MTDKSCKHHEGLEFKIQANTSRIKRCENGFIWMYGLLIANLGSAITLLALQLLKTKP